jgi:hypothetical protein
MTDSSTGGYLQANATPAPLEGQPLLDFLQRWITNICGLPGNMVRPRWQSEPPNIPEAGIAWMSFGIMRRTVDPFPSVIHFMTGDGHDTLIRHETLELLASIFDTGAGGQADGVAAQLRDALTIAQNLEPLLLRQMALLDTGDLQVVPALLNTRWQYRLDFAFRVRRVVQRDYPVENVLEVDGTIVTDSP